MNEHPSRAEISALLQDDLASDRRIKILLHLLQPCEECLAQAPLQIRVWSGFEGEPRTGSSGSRGSGSRHRPRSPSSPPAWKTSRAAKGRDKEGREAPRPGRHEGCREPPDHFSETGCHGSPPARSWAARHEDTNLMVQLAFLAVKRAEKLDAKGTESSESMESDVGRSGAWECLSCH